MVRTISQAALDDAIAWFLGTPIDLVIVLVGALITRVIALRVISRVTSRAVRAAQERSARDGHSPESPEAHIEMLRREQRATSVTALLRTITNSVVWTLTALTVLSMVGINVGPILASAGVVGVALGFGAQTLVKDYLAGFFLILEDQFGIGDLVDVGPVVGVVEEIGLRVTRLRDLSGVVWYVRNGEILRVANRSQGWTMAVVDVPINYDSDLEQVRQIVNEVATAMMEDPICEDLIIDRPEYAGVESVSGEAMVIRITARALPDKQVPASREIRERLKVAFDAAGIKVPVVLRLPNNPPKA